VTIYNINSVQFFTYLCAYTAVRPKGETNKHIHTNKDKTRKQGSLDDYDDYGDADDNNNNNNNNNNQGCAGFLKSGNILKTCELE
jgi:hypothetical protein